LGAGDRVGSELSVAADSTVLRACVRRTGAARATLEDGSAVRATLLSGPPRSRHDRATEHGLVLAGVDRLRAAATRRRPCGPRAAGAPAVGQAGAPGCGALRDGRSRRCSRRSLRPLVRAELSRETG